MKSFIIAASFALIVFAQSAEANMAKHPQPATEVNGIDLNGIDLNGIDLNGTNLNKTALRKEERL